jgi:hypothetical protein
MRVVHDRIILHRSGDAHKAQKFTPPECNGYAVPAFSLRRFCDRNRRETEQSAKLYALAWQAAIYSRTSA